VFVGLSRARNKLLIEDGAKCLFRRKTVKRTIFENMPGAGGSIFRSEKIIPSNVAHDQLTIHYKIIVILIQQILAFVIIDV